jgi:acyl-CoA synthetase (AMP-forming)/AMP-acid ligase II
MLVTKIIRNAALRSTFGNQAIRCASSLRSVFETSFKKLPHKYAFKPLTGDLSFLEYKELNKQSNALVNGLSELGIKKGDTVVAWFGNSVELAALQVAAAKGGYHLALLDATMKDPAAIETALTSVNPTVIIFDASASAPGIILSDIIPELNNNKPGPVSAEKFASLKYVFGSGFNVPSGALMFHQALCYSPQPAPVDHVKITGNEAYLTTFSAANQGEADSKTLTQAEVVTKAQNISKSLNLTSADLILTSCNETSVFGVISNFATWSSNAAVIVPTKLFDVDSTQAALELQPISVLAVDNLRLASIKQIVDKFPKTIRSGIVEGESVTLNGVELMSA